MHNAKHFLLFICFSLLVSQSFAAKVYKRIPFTTTLAPIDTVIVNYDFTEKLGIHCTTTAKQAKTKFSYKGHDKTAVLPMILESDHVPKKLIEQLADVSGQFEITANTAKTKRPYTVHCDYVMTKVE